MADLATTRMSSRGQVVIPEDIRRQMDLKPGTQFVVVSDKDVVILKTITPPRMDQFDDLVDQARKQARQAGLRRSDITAAIDRARART